MAKELVFPLITEKYLKDLSKHNNKDWFEKNRQRFDLEFLQPAIQLVIDLGERLHSLNPNINAVPKIDKSIFRLHRDVRFSKDKSPFKTNLGLYFWEGSKKRMECSGFYVHVEPGSLFWGMGMYAFTPEQLKKYRDVVYNPAKAEKLNKILNYLKKKKYDIGGKSYKKVPRNYDPDYKYKDLLLHSGIYTFIEASSIKQFEKKDFVNFSFKVFKETLPLHQWLVNEI